MAPSSQDRPQHNRSTSSAFSFRSNKSDKSTKGSPKVKIDLTETEEERRRNKFSGKTHVNPNKAIIEAQPSTIAQDAPTTISPLGAVQHKDWLGNPITDPDFSNPARSRLERPLDTIRSFEAAIDGSDRRRTQMLRNDSAEALTAYSSRRNSYVGTDFNPGPRTPAASQYHPQNGYQNGYQYGSRKPSYQRDPYEYPRPQPREQQRRGPGPRMQSAPSFSPRQQYSTDYNQYYSHGQQESIDTNGDSSGTMSEPWTNSTDPSSENSSVDRFHARRGSENGDAYGGQYDRSSPGYNVRPEEKGYDGQMKGRYGHPGNQGQPYYRGNTPTQTLPHKGYPLQAGPAPLPPAHNSHWSQTNVPIPLSQQPLQPPSNQPAYGSPTPYNSQFGSRSNFEQHANPASQQQMARQPMTPQQQRPTTLKKRVSDKYPEKDNRKSWLKRTFSKNK